MRYTIYHQHALYAEITKGTHTISYITGRLGREGDCLYLQHQQKTYGRLKQLDTTGQKFQIDINEQITDGRFINNNHIWLAKWHWWMIHREKTWTLYTPTKQCTLHINLDTLELDVYHNTHSAYFLLAEMVYRKHPIQEKNADILSAPKQVLNFNNATAYDDTYDHPSTLNDQNQ